ncbi:uncharacterized protein C10orf95-like [Neopsephotus bourkii]|uniref:uncharacterized protein C10orf95-like n=1 Tax=Neopsephotus bourkii TaxID=309878 RepID=UPI002AA5CB77|nr:uncharacterized protein C10orf95-like [Neopsephotus bourkii]
MAASRGRRGPRPDGAWASRRWATPPRCPGPPPASQAAAGRWQGGLRASRRPNGTARGGTAAACSQLPLPRGVSDTHRKRARPGPAAPRARARGRRPRRSRSRCPGRSGTAGAVSARCQALLLTSAVPSLVAACLPEPRSLPLAALCVRCSWRSLCSSAAPSARSSSLQQGSLAAWRSPLEHPRPNI